MQTSTKKIGLGGGCFWCIEAVFATIQGIIKTTPGYAGGITKNPTYKEVCNGDTKHAEIVLVEYDPSKINLLKILNIFFAAHDPTTPNRQGEDIGEQYRSIIFYTDVEQRETITYFIRDIKESYSTPIVTEIRQLDNFYAAEDYHHGYYAKNSEQPYCRTMISPKLKKIKEKFGN